MAEFIGLRGFHAEDVKDYMEFLIEGDDDKVSEFLNFVKTDHPKQVKVKEVIVEDYNGIVMQIDRFSQVL
ncbi:MAG: acylphosphatase [Candidatus Brockarchaeota archaeon]|nr:acylphosphatase [Candidatus Brockarchaeota archaeon]